MTSSQERLGALVVHPDASRRATILAVLQESGFSTTGARSGPEAWQRFRKGDKALIFAPAELPGLDGIGLLARVRAISTIPFVLEVRDGDVATAVSGVRGGADIVVQECDRCGTIASIAEGIAAASAAAILKKLQISIPGKSAPIRRLRQKLASVAGVSVPVLLLGEPGAGRRHAARSLIACSSPSSKRLVEIGPNESPRISETNMLRGPVFFDRIPEFPRAAQARLAELLDDERAQGDPSGFRVTASSDIDLNHLAVAGRFDQRLARKLSRFVIEVPPVRTYLSDFREIVPKMGSDIGSRLGRGAVVLTSQAITALQSYPWPGNARQLQTTLEQLIAFSPEGKISKDLVVDTLTESSDSVDRLRRSMDSQQRTELLTMLRDTGGNLAEVARRLGMSRGAIIYRAQKFGLLPERRRQGGAGSNGRQAAARPDS